MQVLAMEVLDQACSSSAVSSILRTTAGTDCKPARLAARQRRSPAISS
jgi:hypothetical protein